MTTRMPSRFTFWNPANSKAISYTPGGSARKRYEPSAPVTCICGWISAGLLAVTLTPGSTAPVLSVTVPLMRPRKSWAWAWVVNNTMRHRPRTSLRERVNIHPPMQKKIGDGVDRPRNRHLRNYAVLNQRLPCARRRDSGCLFVLCASRAVNTVGMARNLQENLDRELR